MTHDEPMYETDEGDSMAFTSIVSDLEGVCKPRSLISQVERDQYDELRSIMVPSSRKQYEEDYEAMLVAVLNALSGAVFKIDETYHVDLVNDIFDMSIWSYGPDAREALLTLVTSLAIVPDKFLDRCFNMLVRSFVPPEKLAISDELKKEVQRKLRDTLHNIAGLVPLASMNLPKVFDWEIKKSLENKSKEVILQFVDCMLRLKSGYIWQSIGSVLLQKALCLLIELDVKISWEDILQDDRNKGIFDIDLEDADENTDGLRKNGLTVPEDNGFIKNNAIADKLDGLMVIICEHLKLCALENFEKEDGSWVEVFKTLLEFFSASLMTTYKSKFAQFVMFYACSRRPETSGTSFAGFLTKVFVSTAEDPIRRMSAVAYLASYLARAKFISTRLVADSLTSIAACCRNYCQNKNGRAYSIKDHRIFYAGCQALMYILCFRMRSLMSIPELKSQLINLNLEPILHHSLEPLKVCLPTIVHEFHRQAGNAHLFTPKYCQDEQILESEYSKTYGGLERWDMFFPFDPYLLKESDRFMRPEYEFWYMVKTTYSDFGSDHEDEPHDGYTSDDVGISEHENADYDTEDGEEDLDYSMNKMSITPKPGFRYHAKTGNMHMPARMPARLSPSLSP